MDATFSSPKNARRESETSGGEPGAPDGGAAFNALGEELLQRITEGPRLCPSRLPEHTNSTWRKQIMRGTGAKARMRENRPEGSFAVSVDERYGNDKFTKSFTFFDSAADLFRQTAHLPQKSFYELIEADRWARLYFDIEHYVDSEAVPSGIEGAVQVVKEQLIHTWPEKFQDAGHVIEDVIILIASRHVDGTGTGKYKHSYHVIFPQIYFYGNYGLMKQFVHSLQGDPRLQARGKNGEPICMIDGNVYHRDQPFRLIESYKLKDGPSGVLRPIAAREPISMKELLRTVVTHDEGDGIRISEESSGRLDVSSGQAARKSAAKVTLLAEKNHTHLGRLGMTLMTVLIALSTSLIDMKSQHRRSYNCSTVSQWPLISPQHSLRHRKAYGICPRSPQSSSGSSTGTSGDNGLPST